MELQFDWSRIHESIVFEQKAGEKSAQVAARQIEQTIRREAWPVGTSLGTSQELCDRFQVGRETLLEAIRLLEVRGVAKMRRGRCGGLISLAMPEMGAGQAIGRYLAGLSLTAGQISEARRAFALLAAHETLIGQGRQDTFERLFRQLIAEGRSPLAEPLPAAYAEGPIRSRAIQVFVEGVDALEAMTGPGRPDRVADCGGSALVKLTQQYLVSEMQRVHADGAEKLGSEAQLAERIGVSRQVLRQALRLLEEQGLLACRRGRSNGIVARATHPASLVGVITELFERQEVREDEFRPALSIIDRINRSLFAAKAEPEHFAAVEKNALGKNWGSSDTHIRRMHIEWPVIDNPVLSLLEQTLAAYRARQVGACITVSNADVDSLHRNTMQHIARMRTRDLPGADEVYTLIQAQVTELLGGH